MPLVNLLSYQPYGPIGLWNTLNLEGSKTHSITRAVWSPSTLGYNYRFLQRLQLLYRLLDVALEYPGVRLGVSRGTHTRGRDLLVRRTGEVLIYQLLQFGDLDVLLSHLSVQHLVISGQRVYGQLQLDLTSSGFAVSLLPLLQQLIDLAAEVGVIVDELVDPVGELAELSVVEDGLDVPNPPEVVLEVEAKALLLPGHFLVQSSLLLLLLLRPFRLQTAQLSLEFFYFVEVDLASQALPWFFCRLASSSGPYINCGLLSVSRFIWMPL
jgi:hypothetical protein